MFIPELLSKAMRRRHRKTFFGDSRSKPFAILTPIKAIFDEFPDGEPVHSSGWWLCKATDNALVVLTPQGTPAIDALCSLEPEVQVIFVGLAGALGTLVVGEIVEPLIALEGSRRRARPSASELVYRNATVATVTSLNESLQKRKDLRRRADCVDMESAWVFGAAASQGRDAKAVLIISDHLFRNSFVETSLDDVSPAIRRVVHDLCRATGAHGSVKAVKPDQQVPIPNRSGTRTLRSRDRIASPR